MPVLFLLVKHGVGVPGCPPSYRFIRLDSNMIMGGSLVLARGLPVTGYHGTQKERCDRSGSPWYRSVLSSGSFKFRATTVPCSRD